MEKLSVRVLDYILRRCTALGDLPRYSAVGLGIEEVLVNKVPARWLLAVSTIGPEHRNHRVIITIIIIIAVILSYTIYFTCRNAIHDGVK